MIFISILTLIVAIALPSINSHVSSLHYVRIASIIFIYAGALSLNAFYIQSIGSGIGVYSGLFQVTSITQFFDIFILWIGALILVSWPLNNNKNLESKSKNITYITNVITIKNYPREYSLIVLISSLGATLLISSSDLISLYLSIELQSFGVYILASIYRNSESAISAGLKYFLLGGLSSCIILLGCAVIYTFTGLTQLESIYSIVSVSDSNSIIQGLSLGLILIFIGLFFKIAAAPLHNWAADVYNNSPTIVTIWLTIMPKISIIIFLLEIQSQIGLIENISLVTQSSEIPQETTILIRNYILTDKTIYLLKNLLLLSSLLSLIIGTIVGLAQSKIKRLLAYSTISHVGFILLALAINTEQSVESLIFYVIQYSLTNLNTFLILISLGLIIHTKFIDIKSEDNNEKIEEPKGTENDINYISELSGQFYKNTLLSISLTICLFSMAGIPPLIGFFSKQFVLYSALQSGYYFMAIVAIIVSLISASYYLKIIRILHSQDSVTVTVFWCVNTNTQPDTYTHKISQSNLETNNSIETNISNYHSYLISTLTLSILLFILNPSILLNSTTILSLSLFNF